MAKAKKGCETCAHAVFERTPTGRIRRTVSGDCRAHVPDLKPLLPSCVLIRFTTRAGIWVGDGVNCPTYKAAESEVQ